MPTEPRPDMRATTAQALIDEWRAKGAGIDTFHATMGTGWKVCADELEAALRAEPVSPQGWLALMAQAAMVALESVQAQGYYFHHADGTLATAREVIDVVSTALDTAMALPAPLGEAGRPVEAPRADMRSVRDG